jgi:hypothetical protein
MLLTAIASPPEVDCQALSPWTNFPHPPQVNQMHIFCGEWANNTPKGFHSRPGGINPSTVGQFTLSQPPNAQGIYGGQWTYRGRPRSEKFSTMFPDTCSMLTVLNSIVHAINHQAPCPTNAPAWAVCGPNRPHPVFPGAGPFCDATDGTVFTIAMGLLANRYVNTAFPLR